MSILNIYYIYLIFILSILINDSFIRDYWGNIVLISNIKN